MDKENQAAVAPVSDKADFKVGNFDLDFKVTEDKKLRIEIKYDGKGIDGGAFAELGVEEFAQKLKDAIPGDGIPEAIIDGLVKALSK